MKHFMIICLGLLWAGTAYTENAVTIPYNEFKALYGERLKIQWEKEHQAGSKKDQKAETFLYTVDQAVYTMTLSSGGALCDVVLTGRAISGKPEPVQLFNPQVIVKDIVQVTGGTLLRNQARKKGLFFLALPAQAFEVKLSFFVQAAEDNQSRFVAMDIPDALINRLDLKTDKNLTVTRVPGIRDSAGYYHFSPGSSLEVRFREKRDGQERSQEKESLSTRYKTVRTPQVVLDALQCFTSFEENGNALTVLRMNIPSEAGEALTIKAVPHATIWNFRVNGKKMKVFEKKEQGTFWILPLAKDRVSAIELTLLSRGDKMGLSGRLSWALPPLGFPARTVNVALGLPRRVELMAFEGPVSPSEPFEKKPPGEFIGKPYYFSQSFYNGGGIDLAVSYKEPVK